MLKKFLVLSLLFFISNIHAAEQGETDFKLGVKQFKEERYQKALDYFKSAEKKGMRKNALTFNMAATYYYLKKYSNAETLFKRLTNTRNFKHIAYFNLGLIAEKQGKKPVAINYFKKTVDGSKNQKLTKLAKYKIYELTTNKKSKTIATVIFGIGSDDNVTRTASTTPTNTKDNLTELFAYYKTPLNEEINFKGAFYQHNYNTLSTENFRFISLSMEYPIKKKSWTITPEAGFITSYLNNTGYQSILDLKVEGKTKLDNESKLALRYRMSNISSQSAVYNYLQGQRHQLRADYKRSTNLGKLRLRYQLEINNRENTTVKNYSPTRNTFRARLKQRLSKKWKTSEEISFRNSQYGSAGGVSRRDNRTRLQLAAERIFNSNWSASVNFLTETNSSNLSAESYNRNLLMLYANWTY